MRRTFVTLSYSAAALLFAAAPVLAATAGAEAPESQSEAGHQATAELQAFSRASVPMSTAITTAEKQGSGKALSASFDTHDGKPAYDVLVFANNQESHVWVDANSGQTATGPEPATPAAKLDQEDMAELNTIKAAKVDLRQAVDAAEQKGNGKALDASIEDHAGHASYEIQTVANGKMQMFTVDTQSGMVQPAPRG